VVDPVIPKKLRKKHAVGVLQATMEANGTFDGLSFVGGDRGLEESSLDAVRQWQYSPATLNGSPVQTQVFVIIDSNKSKLNTRLELDTPFPTKPKTPLEDQIAERLLFKSDPRRMHPPKVLYQPDPEYSEAARYAKFQGMLVLGMIVGRDGDPKDVWVVKKLGLGLDQKAI
jgi:Gram-negative bacterial TonB protein C-terminal